ncbi:3'(2'),5'-bisphosphate nucleotidase CysQ [Promicromonospora iranensis]|uniref:3'(2'), 5'-bisphosphate nucleotidase n=1 Tax=Promicromonospora iranensis TaxID=1105144 RepID=A0ABU2CSF0_9MICO|nr:3'(2'),5'-bisphosphate nucleotidase CysQ [Promicromonospora iranensis]MDR7384092.1 3'(2'), 5'-bisphosphate nucleotidase [Promicromonospora iranensis]
MNAPSPTLPQASLDDDALAHALASGAAEVLVALRAEVDAAGGSFVAAELKDAGDAAAQAWLAAALAAARPGDAVLSEEASDDESRTRADRVWIIDPLDGTREFAERYAEGPQAGRWRDDFAVHVALWERGKELTVGAVALPARTEVLTTAHGVVPDDESEAVLSGSRPLRIAASRSRPPEFVAALAERGDVELVPMGSAGVKVMAVVDGTVDAYVHGGGQYEWDSAAPVAVARSRGLVCTRLDGSGLEYNRESPWLPDLFVCPPALAQRLRELLDTVGVASVVGADSKVGAKE